MCELRAVNITEQCAIVSNVRLGLVWFPHGQFDAYIPQCRARSEPSQCHPCSQVLWIDATPVPSLGQKQHPQYAACQFDSRLPYLELPFCVLPNHQGTAVLILAVWTVFLFVNLALILDFRVVPNLNAMKSTFKMRSSLARACYMDV